MKKADFKQIKSSFSKLIKSNKFLLGFSIFVAFILWIWVSVEKSPIVDNVIVSVPVHIDFEDSLPEKIGLRMFGNTTFTVDVTVSGKKFVVSNLTANDIKVVAVTSDVDSAGTKSLALKSSVNGDKEFQIKSMSQYYVSVYFDLYKESEFSITPNIVSLNPKTVIDGCYLGDPILSRSVVTVSGPSTEVSKITGIRANYTLSDVLSTTTTVVPELEFIGASESQLTNTSIDLPDTVNMVLPVLKDVTLPTSVGFKNVPSDYSSGGFKFTVFPSSVTVGIPVEQVGQMTEFKLDSIDFSELNAGNNTFNVSTDSIAGYNIKGDISSFKINVYFDGLTSKIINVPASSLSITKQNGLYDSSIVTSTSYSVRVVGPEAALNEITADSFRGEIDLSEFDLADGSNTVPVRFVLLNSQNNCWVYGDYTAIVNSVLS